MQQTDSTPTQPQSMVLTATERQLVGSLCDDRSLETEAELTRTFARIAWARLTEPGDRVATLLIRELGVVNALNQVIQGKQAETTRLIRRKRDQDSQEIVLSSRELSAAFSRWRPRLDRQATGTDLRAAQTFQMRVVTPEAVNWPTNVNDLGEHAPLLLWVRGKTELLLSPGLSIVGARASTSYGEHVTGEFAYAAVRRGRTVVSGAAYGIDAVAHRTALASESPTIAVLAGGADRLYPSGHTQLLSSIMAAGAVVSEVNPGTAPTRWRFLQRNRLIAALSSATLVCEAGVRSGSLNTAGHAAQLGRGLGAVPGPITSAGSHGCFTLMNDYGADLITNESDLESLMGTDSETVVQAFEREPTLHRRTLDALPLRGARTVNEVARLAGLSPEQATVALAELELLGAVLKKENVGREDPTWAVQSTKRVR